MKLLILGANGFIGSHLSEAILDKTDWQIFAMDLAQDKIIKLCHHPRFHFLLGDITQQTDWINEHIKCCDVVLPLVAIATPATYVQNPIRVFELDFEANLAIVRQCVRYQKRIIFPSTSEVYGMCTDAEFNEGTSSLVTGPIHKKRWIYSASKQLLDRLIYAYGEEAQLAYSLFRPFNWYGPRLDDVFNPKPGGSRVLTQFIGNILRGEPISLVNGGHQKRCFTYVDDGIAALLKIIENKTLAAEQRVFNIGNPEANISIRQLAEMLIQLMIEHYPLYAAKAKATKLMDVTATDYFGQGYQDVSLRVPAIVQAKKYLSWEPTINIKDGLRKTLDFYCQA